jgi:hypothetical protein
MDVVSDSVNDSAAGTGLRTLLISGVDGTGAEISEVVTMNGTTDVTTVNSYLRVNFMTGITAGSTGFNEGIVTATASTAATTQSHMGVNTSITTDSHYTVPLGKSAFAAEVQLNVAKNAGGQLPLIEFKGFVRDSAANSTWIQFFDQIVDSNVENSLFVPIQLCCEVPAAARADIRIRATTDQNNSEFRTRMFLILIDD